MTNRPILPGATIGILGAGQLGKMSLVAAHQLGYHTTVYAVKGDIPAMEMATNRLVVPDWNDSDSIDQLVKTCDVITTEWENVPLSLIKELERRGAVVRPSSRVLEIAQSRYREKLMAGVLSIPTTRCLFLRQERLLDEVFNENVQIDWFLPGILKTNGLGYDGQGQFPITTIEELTAAHEKVGVDCVLEKRIDLAYELSVLVARTKDGKISVSDVVENSHLNGILDRTVWPLSSRKLTIGNCLLAQEHAQSVAEYLGLEGVLCLEFFVDKENCLFFNEMAPRPHNSFHGTIEAAYTSQFEQHIRAICGLPLGNVCFHSKFEMRNLIGGAMAVDPESTLNHPQTRLHLYGKASSRPGRKMGHVTRLLR